MIRFLKLTKNIKLQIQLRISSRINTNKSRHIIVKLLKTNKRQTIKNQPEKKKYCLQMMKKYDWQLMQQKTKKPEARRLWSDLCHQLERKYLPNTGRQQTSLKEIMQSS